MQQFNELLNFFVAIITGVTIDLLALCVQLVVTCLNFYF